MCFVRGSILKGYVGIVVKCFFYNGYLIRLLFGVMKEEIVDYCNKLNLMLCIDLSNKKEVYIRNWLCKYVFFYLKEENL